MKELKLVFPTLEMKKQALTYREDHFNVGEFEISGDGGLDHAENYETWIEKINFDLKRDDGTFVSSTQYFAFVNDKIVGTIQIRHKLNDFLFGYGGHIGYGVAPPYRRKGYATKMLSLALEKCWEMGIEKALVTCDNDNIGSMKTIIKNKGILENEITQKNGKITQRYWIKNPNYI